MAFGAHEGMDLGIFLYQAVYKVGGEKTSCAGDENGDPSPVRHFKPPLRTMRPSAGLPGSAQMYPAIPGQACASGPAQLPGGDEAPRLLSRGPGYLYGRNGARRRTGNPGAPFQRSAAGRGWDFLDRAGPY